MTVIITYISIIIYIYNIYIINMYKYSYNVYNIQYVYRNIKQFYQIKGTSYQFCNLVIFKNIPVNGNEMNENGSYL